MMQEQELRISGTRFGEIEYSSDDVLRLAGGLIGFERCESYVILNHKPDSPFRWLQSLDEPHLAILVVEPGQFVADYSFEVPESDAAQIELSDPSAAVVYTTATIPKGQPNDMTLNLAGPIVINAANRCAKQIVLDEPGYTVKHRAFPAREQSDQAA